MILKGVLVVEPNYVARGAGHVVAREPIDGRVLNIVAPVVAGRSKDNVSFGDSVLQAAETLAGRWSRQ